MYRPFLATFIAAVALALPSVAEPPAKPKLAVLVVFDQMRGDYLSRWQSLFGPDGFRRLQTDGMWFTNCHYPYAMTATGPGHASMLSGCSGDKHGIVANSWYDRENAKATYCASSDRFVRVPPVLKVAAPKVDMAATEDKEPRDKRFEEDKPKGSGAPTEMLAETLGDAVKAYTHDRGKVFGLSLKDRSAVLPAGKKPNGCYWFEDGLFVSSTYYNGGLLHSWVNDYNKEKSCDRWYGQTWDLLKPTLNYAKYSGPDDQKGEGKGAKQGIMFPHPMGNREKLDADYYKALANSPFGNQVLLDLARRAIIEEKLGQRDEPDLLIISFSSNDLVGHTWGPDSQEVLDITLRSDLIVRDLLACLDQYVGKDRYILGLTADHGVCPLPEIAMGSRAKEYRIDGKFLFTKAEAFLREKFPTTESAATNWFEKVNEGGVYLNRRVLKARKLSDGVVATELAKWLSEQPGIQVAYTRDQLIGPIPTTDAIGLHVKKSFHPDRSGDVLYVPKLYHLIGSQKTGTNHGTPHPYDTHVPLIVFGAGVNSGHRGDPVTPQLLAKTFARALGIPAPAQAEAPVPEGLFE